MSTFRFRAFGAPAVQRTLERYGDRASNLYPANQQVADLFMRHLGLRFATQGFGTWPELAESTREQKARKGQDPRILQATGDLRRSLTIRGDQNMDLFVGRGATNGFLRLGTKLDYGVFHQEGRGVPVRKPIAFNERTKRQAIKILQRHIVEGR